MLKFSQDVLASNFNMLILIQLIHTLTWSLSGVLDCAGEFAESCYSCVESSNKCGICEGASGGLICLSTNVTIISDITQYCASGE